MTLVVDGSGQILGRLASLVAKRLLEGERVIVVNSEKIVLSGRRGTIFREHDEWMEVKGRANPRKGPKHFRRPEDIFRQVVRGMLPIKKAKGREALGRLRVHVGVPEDLSNVPKTAFREASASKLGGGFVTLGELSRYLGAEI
jgi:large subunit ribosomal protein L13